MTTAVELSDQQQELLKELTKESDITAALRTAVTEYIRYAKRMQLIELSGKVEMLQSGGTAPGHSAPAAENDLDHWYAELEAGCSQLDPEDDQLLRQGIQEVRAEEKELARKQSALEQ